MNGEMKFTMDKKACILLFKDSFPHNPKNISIENKDSLNGKIEGVESISALEWMKEHVEKEVLFSKNILTNVIRMC